MFIVLEGADGTGKSTQAKILANTLRGEGREVVTTFEPGGTDTGETLRKLVLESGVSPIAETLLMAAEPRRTRCRSDPPGARRGSRRGVRPVHAVDAGLSRRGS